jgi:hypothetical protein
MKAVRLLSGREIFEVGTPVAFSSLVRGGGPGEAGPGWWESLIAACNSHYVEALDGRGEVRPWGEALLAVLEAARRSGVVRVAEVLKRKIVVERVLLDELGEAFGDANAVCAELLGNVAETGLTPDGVAEDLSRLEAGVRPPVLQMAEIQGLRQVFEEAIPISRSVTDEHVRSDLDSWHRAFGLDPR